MQHLICSVKLQLEDCYMKHSWCTEQEYLEEEQTTTHKLVSTTLYSIIRLHYDKACWRLYEQLMNM